MVLTKNLTESIKKHALPFQCPDDLYPLIHAASHAKYVLLGEASHGTSEYYKTRTEITKKLIQENNFNFIAVEGDWPSCYEVNRYVKGYDHTYKNGKEVLEAFNRWPTWMWSNEEVLELIEWLKKYNETQEVKVGFYGLDVYSLWESMEAIIAYLENTNSPHIEKAKKAFECFEPFHRQAEQYAVSAAIYGEDCMNEVLDLLRTMTANKKYYENDTEASLNLLVNSLVTANAEFYYHTMITNDNESWNIRDRHMVQVLDHVSEYIGESAKGIVWEHNTHIGDARATDMYSQGMVNIGQLTREKYNIESVFAVGFGSYKGTVIASTKWGTPYEVMNVPEATPGSFEYYLHQASSGDKFLLFNEDNQHEFSETIGHRAIGVVYHPEYEHMGNYVPSRISQRYNAFIYHETTEALHPITVNHVTV
ncbi:erythromycin esterase family protein [Bacillus suaedaesalsae]|uniref:Erythromycin esterase family protein n=1 Tax=Bacillus suaedaesalsae TaxID=2810349 RepID=A0ABS2DGY3_9BACI|nr:erythromycin esterase family protein [Bacillus suaedaesalsae]MBM6617737.1 erythromycin esterase family protein [Bacillus suaedaesalsae]